MAGLYVHIPFCLRKCRYCDFVSFPPKGEELEGYAELIEQEISLLKEEKEKQIHTVYIGGGTPSVLPSIPLLMKLLRRAFDILPHAEITVEVNPATVDEGKLTHYLEAGINRLSMGVQSFIDGELQGLGRLHCAREATETFRAARRAGFRNINMDLIYGIPHETLSSWEETLQQAVSLEPAHLSCYSLILEEGTPLADMVAAGEVQLPDEEETEKMADALRVLEQHGYHRYEVSNYAKAGYESRHNLNYWDNGEYIGLGCGAHSHIGYQRIENVPDLAQYRRLLQEDRRPVAQILSNTVEDECFETVMMGLRKVQGIDLMQFEVRFGVSAVSHYRKAVDKNLKLGLLELSAERLYLTPLGMDLMNTVLMDFMD